MGRESLSQIVAVGASVHQGGYILGSMIGGTAFTLAGIEFGLSLVAAFSFAAIGLALPLHGQGRVPPGGEPTPYSSAVSDGFRLIFGDQRLLMVCLSIALLMFAAQTSIVLLAAFTRFELGLGADAYGWIDAMWGVGAVAAGIVFVWIAQPLSERFLRRFGLLLLAAATAGFSAAQGLLSALLLHCLMGVIFAVNRIVYDAYILKTVDGRMVGRVRNNIQAAIGAIGIIVYLSPSLYTGLSVRTVYIVSAAFLALAAMALVIWHHCLEVEERRSSGPSVKLAGHDSSHPRPEMRTGLKPGVGTAEDRTPYSGTSQT